MIPGATGISDSSISALPFGPATDAIFSFVMDASAGGEFKLYAGTTRFLTALTDVPPVTPFAGHLRKSFSFSRSIASLVGGVSESFGDLALENSEADYDDVEINRALDGGRVVIKVGQVDDDGRAIYSSFFTVADLIASRKTADETVFRVSLTDKSFLLDVPAQPQVYGGTGQLDGGPEVAGKRKPWALGWLTGISPAPVIPVEGIYQVSYRSVQAISAVYDNGASYTPTSDYPNSVALRTATLVPGQYATCIAEGLLRIGGSAFGTLTADVAGDNVGGLAQTTAGIVRRLALVAAELAAGEIAENTFDLLDLQQPAPIGYFLAHTADETVEQVIQKLMNGIRGYAGFSLRLAQLEVGKFSVPSFIAAADYNEQRVLSIRREPMPDDVNPPPFRRRATYARNWTPLQAVAGEVTDRDRIAYLQSQFKVASTPDAAGDAILADHPLAKDTDPTESYFRDLADAQAFVDNDLDLFADSPGQYHAKLHSHPFVHEIGETVRLIKPRFDLTNGKRVVLVTIDDNIGDDGDIQDIVGVG
jgi:hypothetical protein